MLHSAVQHKRQTLVLTPLGFSLLRQLADGAFHSGEDLAETVGLTMADQPKGIRCAELFHPDPDHAADDVTVGEGGAVEIKLEPYAARWFRLVTDRDTALI